MEKIVNKQTSIFKKILIVVGIIIGLPVVAIIILLLIQPLIDGIDQSKFMSLKSQTQSIFNDIQRVSAGADAWTYEASCIPELAGDWPTGNYSCSTTALLIEPVVSAAQIKSLHEKYYPIINNSKYLKAIGSLFIASPYQFGTDFVINDADRQYKTGDGYLCTYSAKLTQPNGQGLRSGTPISVGSGQAILTFDCTGKSSGNWYKS